MVTSTCAGCSLVFNRHNSSRLVNSGSGSELPIGMRPPGTAQTLRPIPVISLTSLAGFAHVLPHSPPGWYWGTGLLGYRHTQ